MVPEGWSQRRLGEFMSFKNGMNTEKSQYGSGEKFINVMDVFKNDTITKSKIIGAVQATEKQLVEYGVKYGDVLFNRTSETFDEIAMSAVYVDDASVTFGGFVIRGRPSQKVILPDYSIYAFQASDFRRQAIRFGQGAVRSNIGQKDLARVSIALPPIREQAKIAKLLSTWDKVIGIAERLLANSEKQKKALMQQLLTGNKRLPQFSSKWTDGVIQDVANITKGKALGSKDLSPGIFPVIAGGKTSPYTHSAYTHENAITVSASGAYAGYVAFHPYKIWASDCSVITNRKNSSIRFLYFWLQHNQKKIYSLQSGGAQPHVYSKDIASLKIAFPPLKEQESIAAIIETSAKECDLLKTELERLKQEKKALMQQLLTGKRRVNVSTTAKEACSA